MLSNMSATVWGIVVNALAALGSFSAAAVALWIATKDRRERERERAADAQAQANLVQVTVRTGTSGRFIVNVTNHGSLPLLDVRFESASYAPRPTAKAVFPDRAPRLIPVLKVGDDSGNSWFEFLDGDEPVITGSYGALGEWKSDDPAASDPINVSVTVRWQDAYGQSWELSHPGLPNRI